MRIEGCPACHRPFSVELTGNYPSRDREDVICPHCKTVCRTALARADFETKPLPPEDEERYLASKRR